MNRIVRSVSQVRLDDQLAAVALVVELEKDGAGVRRLALVEHAERMCEPRDGRVVSAVHREFGARALQKRRARLSRARMPLESARVVRRRGPRGTGGCRCGCRLRPGGAHEVEHQSAHEFAGAQAEHLMSPGLEVPVERVQLVQFVENSLRDPRGLRHVVRHLQCVQI